MITDTTMQIELLSFIGDKLHKNEYGRPEDITVNQIKAISYNGKTLYKA